MKITVDGKEKEKKKTFPPEIGVLNFLDWDSKAPPTTGAAGQSLRGEMEGTPPSDRGNRDKLLPGS